jgi:hypothetical protein
MENLMERGERGCWSRSLGSEVNRVAGLQGLRVKIVWIILI